MFPISSVSHANAPAPTQTSPLKTLCVGGRTFFASQETFERVTSATSTTKVTRNEAFIDRDGDSFAHVIAHMRGRAVPPDLGKEEQACLAVEADYFALDGLAHALADGEVWRSLLNEETKESRGKLHSNEKAAMYYSWAMTWNERGSEMARQSFARAVMFDPHGYQFRSHFLDRTMSLRTARFVLSCEQIYSTRVRPDAYYMETQFDEAIDKALMSAYRDRRNELTSPEWRRLAMMLWSRAGVANTDDSDSDSEYEQQPKDDNRPTWSEFRARLAAAGETSGAMHIAEMGLASDAGDKAAVGHHMKQLLDDNPKDGNVRAMLLAHLGETDQLDACIRTCEEWDALCPDGDPILKVAQLRLVQATRANDETVRDQAVEKAQQAYTTFIERTQRRDTVTEKGLAFYARTSSISANS